MKTYGYRTLKVFSSNTDYKVFFIHLNRLEVNKTKKFFELIDNNTYPKYQFFSDIVPDNEVEQKCTSDIYHKINGHIKHDAIKKLIKSIQSNPASISLIREEIENQILRLFDTNIFVVIGAGPAGLTVAFNLARGGKQVIVLYEKMGGQIVSSNHIDNFPGFEGNPTELILKMKTQCNKYGVEFIQTKVDTIEADTSLLNKNYKVCWGSHYVLADCVIVATGKTPLIPDDPNVKRLIGKGISECVSCDGVFFKGERVIVIGKGDTAFTYVIQLKELGAEPILLIGRDKPKAQKYLIEKAKKLRINYYCNSQLLEVIGKSEVSQARVSIEGTEKLLYCKGIFFAIGAKKNDNLYKDIPLTDNKQWLQGDNLYVVGDCYKGNSVVACCAYAFNLAKYILEK